ncbi:MAG: hypothetical protein ACRC5T_11225 [Cetobacterium sp.]
MTNAIILTLLITVLNIGRGGRYFPEHILFSKWAIVIYQMLLFYAFTYFEGYNPLYAILFIIPHAVELAIGTGEQMQVANEGSLKDYPINEEKPLNEILLFILDIDAKYATDADKRRLSAWYCSIVGIIFYLPFLITSWKIGLPVLAYGFILGVFRYIPPIYIFGVGDLTWRIVKEGFYIALYTSLFVVSLSLFMV